MWHQCCHCHCFISADNYIEICAIHNQMIQSWRSVEANWAKRRRCNAEQIEIILHGCASANSKAVGGNGSVGTLLLQLHTWRNYSLQICLVRIYTRFSNISTKISILVEIFCKKNCFLKQVSRILFCALFNFYNFCAGINSNCNYLVLMML